jgi:hypothetical protein
LPAAPFTCFRFSRGAEARPCVLLLERNEVRLDATNLVAREREDVAEDEPMELTTLVGGLTVADRDHGVCRFDEAIDGQGRAAHKLVILDNS